MLTRLTTVLLSGFFLAACGGEELPSGEASLADVLARGDVSADSNRDTPKIAHNFIYLGEVDVGLGAEAYEISKLHSMDTFYVIDLINADAASIPALAVRFLKVEYSFPPINEDLGSPPLSPSPTVSTAMIPLLIGVPSEKQALADIPQECQQQLCELKDEYLGKLLNDEIFRGSTCVRGIESSDTRIRLFFSLYHLSFEPYISYGLRLTGSDICTDL